MSYIFKGRSKYSKQWHYGDLIQSENKMWIIDQDYEARDGKIELGTSASPEVDPKTVKLLPECTDEEWLHCQVEKRGCKGYFYNKIEKEKES